MDKEVKKFKEDYKNIKARVKLIKKKIRDLKKETNDLKKETRSVSNLSYNLYHRGIKTMYKKVEGSDIDWKPKFSGLDRMIDNLEGFIFLDSDILRDIEDILKKG